MKTILSKKSISFFGGGIIAFLVILCIAISFYHQKSSDKANIVQTLTTSQQSIPFNEEKEGVFTRITYGGSQLLFAANTLPMLNAGSLAQEELLARGSPWKLSPEFFPRYTIFDSQYVYFMNGAFHFFDLQKKQESAVIPFPLMSENLDAQNAFDALSDFLGERLSGDMYVLVQRNVLPADPYRINGVVQKNSSAEIWRIRSADKSAEKLLTINPENAKAVSVSLTSLGFHLPLKIVPFGQQMLLVWDNKVELLNTTMLHRETLLTVPDETILTAQRSPSEQRILIAEQNYSNTKTEFWLLSEEDVKLHQFASVNEPISLLAIWSPDEKKVLFTGYPDRKLLVLSLSKGTLQTLVSPFTAPLPYVWLANGSILFGVDRAQTPFPAEETPETEYHYLWPLVTWDPVSGQTVYLKNHRAPVFLGKQDSL